MQEKWVISLGGSRISPSGEEVDYKFLENFKKLILKHPSKKFVVVTGGGSTARKYITALRKMHKSTRKQSMMGISITRLHASLLMRLMGKPANEVVPRSMKKVEDLLEKNKVVFCGALRYKDKNTSDGTAADLAAHLKCSFINLTNVKGIYSSNPKTNKNAKFIKTISWKKFYEKAMKIKYEAGQHFVLDQNAAKTILKGKIPTYIVGSLSDIDKIVSGKKNYSGSLITG